MPKKGVHRVYPTEAETARLIRETLTNGKVVDLAFGPSGAWIQWEGDEPIPWTVLKIAEWRGVLAEGMDGAGI